MSSDPEWDAFLTAFRLAASRVAGEYFAPRVHGGGVVRRERVYAYELYHQLRSALPETRLQLHGEMDKGSHPRIPGAVKPDLIVHAPGTMAENLVAIEIKSVVARPLGFLKDLGTLTLLRGVGQYRHAVLLVFGARRGPEIARRLNAERVDPLGRLIDRQLIDLYVHERPGSEPMLMPWGRPNSMDPTGAA